MPTGPATLRPRSTAAVVLTRLDPAPGPRRHRPQAEALPDGTRWPGWLERLIWVGLGWCVAAAWAALLLGDSLSE
jgi:hypothetical protein